MNQPKSETRPGAATDLSTDTETRPASEFGNAPTLTIVPRPRKKNLSGLPIEIAGSVWYLPSLGFSARWTEERDRIYDESLLGGSVFSADIDSCAFAIFWMNYDLEPEEIVALIRQADRKELVALVTGNTLNLDVAPERQSFTHYARTALRSCGLDPDLIPPEECAGVLQQLVASGRVAGHETFTRAGEYAGVKGELMSLIG